MCPVLATTPQLLTADEFLRLPDAGQRRELRRGVVRVMNPPGFRHGEVCSNIHFHLDSYVRSRQIGRTLTNDSGIVTERNPDTVRGADVTYYSYARMPREQRPVGYAGVAPEIVFEVVSPYNVRTEIAQKTAEYLRAGVCVVAVVDPEFETVNLHYADRPSATLRGDEELTFAELPDFRLPARRLFE